MLEVLHPDRVGQFAAEELDDTQMDEENDDEFAVSSKPKQLASDVVRGFFLIFIGGEGGTRGFYFSLF